VQQQSPHKLKKTLNSTTIIHQNLTSTIQQKINHPVIKVSHYYKKIFLKNKLINFMIINNKKILIKYLEILLNNLIKKLDLLSLH
jgi:hypothetical protein